MTRKVPSKETWLPGTVFVPDGAYFGVNGIQGQIGLVPQSFDLGPQLRQGLRVRRPGRLDLRKTTPSPPQIQVESVPIPQPLLDCLHGK
jgi:hypothetical protein